MEYAISILEKERLSVISALKDGQKERLSDLQQLDKALGWLRLLAEKQVDSAGKYNFESLPFIEGHGGFTNYRVVIDNETDDPSFWQEYEKQDGSHFLLSLGDYIVESKQ